MKNIKHYWLASIIGVLTIGSSMAHASNLFSEIPPAKLKITKPALQPGEVSAKYYSMRTDLVTQKSADLTFNLANDLIASATMSNAKRNSQGSLVWRGNFGLAKSGSHKNPSDNTVILVKTEKGITGTIRINGQLYKVRPVQGNVHSVILINEKAMPSDHPPGAMDDIESKFDQQLNDFLSQQVQSVSKTVEEIDILVAYTAAANNAVADINGLIQLAVAETNTGYQNSNVDINMNLVHTYQVSYSERGFSTDLAYFRTPNDGVMDEVHGKRDQFAADVAMLMTNASEYCGLASGIGSTSSTAFAAVYHGCATGYYSFGHEVGHLQAARHDPANDPTTTPYAFAHGYQYSPGGWRTIMAYNCSGGCTRINWWSNPNVTYGGVPMGTSSQSDNARALNLTAASMAAFKGGSTPPPTGGELTNGVSKTGLSGAAGSQQFFTLNVPAGASSLSFQMSGGSGDADLYVRFGSQPTTSTYDCRPYLNGNNETCNINNVQAGTYNVMLNAYAAYSNVSLVANYSEGSTGFSDTSSFESGLDGWVQNNTSNAFRYQNSTYAYDGNWSTFLNGYAYIYKEFDLSSASQATIDFFYYPIGMDNGDVFRVYYYNGSSWSIIATYTAGSDFSNNQHFNVNLTINSSQYNFASNSRFAILNDSASGDYIGLDLITISSQ
ncbi:MAG: pre-peptidase C-terminal domain-containing protein [Kangiellaceae bacterium]|jgi:hypothetical protein|nr:pre-peptidase C-terminal domain-containing protein [Kangiellaceae bacterium]